MSEGKEHANSWREKFSITVEPYAVSIYMF